MRAFWERNSRGNDDESAGDCKFRLLIPMRRAEISMLTAEELRLLRRKRRRIFIVVVLALVLGIGGYFTARPARNAIKGWQARRHAQKAFGFIERQEWKEAKDSAVAAYQLRSTEPEALRAVARFLSRTRQQQALEFWDQLATKQPLTREDRYDEAVIALVVGELTRAAVAVDHLLANDGREAIPRDWLLAAQLRLQQGASEKAFEALGKIFADAAAIPREQFQATLLQLQSARSGNPDFDQRNQQEAWQRLNKFAQGEDAVALDSLVLLAQKTLSLGGTTDQPDIRPLTSDLSPDEIIRRLETHPLAKAPQKLLALDLRLQSNPAEKENLVTRAIADWGDAEPSQLAVLATWLNGKGEFQRNLSTISSEQAIQSRELFLQHVDALGALGRWDEIKRLLDAERFPLDPVIQRMYLARCNAQLGQDAAAKNNWERALEAAGGDAGKLMTLAEYAEKNGAGQIADLAYSAAALSAPKLRAAQQGRLRAAQAAKDTKRMHTILAGMLQVWPSDTAVQNDEAYTRLLLLPNSGGTGAVPSPETDATAGVPPDQIVAIEKLAERLVQQNPASLPHRTLLALARLRQGRAVAALQAYDNISVAPNALTPSALAVHAAVLGANGHTEAARAEIAKAPVEALLPEEQSGTANLRE